MYLIHLKALSQYFYLFLLYYILSFRTNEQMFLLGLCFAGPSWLSTACKIKMMLSEALKCPPFNMIQEFYAKVKK